MSNSEAQKLSDYCQSALNLNELPQPAEYGYPYLVLCVIDAIFSIGVRYSSTLNTVNKFKAYIGDPDDFSLQETLALYQKETAQGMAERVYKNRQRTSARNGILKSEAVLRVVEVLVKHQIETIEDMKDFFYNPAFEADFKQIPGQSSGISLQYFYMLTGNQDEIKPDRMVVRFIETCLNRTLSPADSTALVIEACQLLKPIYPNLTPRSLDHEIWKFQREQ